MSHQVLFLQSPDATATDLCKASLAPGLLKVIEILKHNLILVGPPGMAEYGIRRDFVAIEIAQLERIGVQ